MKHSVLVRTAIAVAFGVMAATVTAHAAVVSVTPANMGSWAFDNRDVNGNLNAESTAWGGMVNGPGTPPLGVGSANLAVGNGGSGGDGTEELRNTSYAGTLLSSITALSYSTYVTQNNGQQFPYLALMISTTGGSTPDDILFFEPPYQTPTTGDASLPNQGATTLNTWQTWNALEGGWWDNINNPGAGTNVEPLSYFLTLYPDATIVNDSSYSPTLGGVRLNVGFAGPTDQFVGYVDNLTIGVNGSDSTYDFDPVPEPASLALLGLALAGLGAARRRRGRAVR